MAKPAITRLSAKSDPSPGETLEDPALESFFFPVELAEAEAESVADLWLFVLEDLSEEDCESDEVESELVDALLLLLELVDVGEEPLALDDPVDVE